ncbi:MAG TPA: alkaline phosphatase family protein, partial [Candidatus Tumulicola sp.]|nr:alkaline phosphatase family protein [Candidatus Tumulicola sp.]
MIRRAFACAIAVAVAACGGHSPGAALPQTAPAPAEFANRGLPTPLRHIVIVVQENRSFENFFAGFPGADAPMTGKTHDGKTVRLKPITFAKVSLNHFYKDGRIGYNHGRMNGFDRVPPMQPFGKLEPYSYVERSLIRPYWTMAQQYVLADHMFPTEWGPSFTAHLNLVAGTTVIRRGVAIVDMPTLDGAVKGGGCDADPGTVTSLLTAQGEYRQNEGPFPCFSFQTLAGVLDPGHVSWKYYAAYWPNGKTLWNAFDAIRAVRYGPDWKQHVVKTPKQILTDAAAGKLPAVSWVIPTMPDS